MYKIVLLVLLLSISTSYSKSSIDGCFQYFAQNSNKLDELLKLESGTNYQLNIWNHRSNKSFTQADEIEESLEQFLINGHIYSEEFIDEGLNGAMPLGLKYNINGVFKEGGSSLSNIASEVASFKIDRLFGFDLVPVTVERTNNGRSGSLQLFVKDAQMEVVLEGRTIPQNELTKMKVLDYLIDNQDRHGGNYLLTKYNKIVAVDHGLALRKKALIAPKFDKQALDFFNSQKGKKLLSTIKSTPDEFIKKEFKGLLSDEIIDGFIYRKNALVDLIK